LDTSSGSTTVFRLPRSHWHCQLDNFQWDAVRPKALLNHIQQFLQSAEAGGDPHLILQGEPGVGKTHVGVAVYRWMVPKVGTIQATWIDVPNFCDEVKAAYSGDAGDPMDDYRQARRLVVLDDLAGRALSQHESQIVYRLLDIAYQNKAAMLITMNQTIEALHGLLPPHEISRLLAHSTIIPISTLEGDWRQRPQ
jgi:DNA replication protein DnaC